MLAQYHLFDAVDKPSSILPQLKPLLSRLVTTVCIRQRFCHLHQVVCSLIHIRDTLTEPPKCKSCCEYYLRRWWFCADLMQSSAAMPARPLYDACRLAAYTNMLLF